MFNSGQTHVNHGNNVQWLVNLYESQYDLYLIMCRAVNRILGQLSGNWYSIFCVACQQDLRVWMMC